MTPEIATTHEAPPVRESIELNPPSLAAQRRIATGEFAAQPTGDIPTKIDSRSLNALKNQNEAVRKADEEKFAREHQKIPPEELRHEQMKVWSFGIWNEMRQLFNSEQGEIIDIFMNPKKLGMPITPGQNNLGDLIKQFYDADTHTEGAFYKNFCTGNMNQRLTESDLTVDDMMRLKQFLTKWMLGSDEAFDALIALRHTKDSLADTTKKTGNADCNA